MFTQSGPFLKGSMQSLLHRIRLEAYRVSIRGSAPLADTTRPPNQRPTGWGVEQGVLECAGLGMGHTAVCRPCLTAVRKAPCYAQCGQTFPAPCMCAAGCGSHQFAVLPLVPQSQPAEQALPDSFGLCIHSLAQTHAHSLTHPPTLRVHFSTLLAEGGTPLPTLACLPACTMHDPLHLDTSPEHERLSACAWSCSPCPGGSASTLRAQPCHSRPCPAR